MRFSVKYLFWMGLILLLTLSCAIPQKKPARRIDYYTLEYPPPETQTTASVPAALAVRHFQIAPAYNTNKIVYREKEFVRNTYHYHKWRANPAELVAYFLARDLQHSAAFQAVFTPDQSQPVTHFLEGTVDDFFEYDLAQTWEAVLSVSVTLLKAKEPDISKRILLQRHYSVRKPCQRKNPQALASAMSEAMAELSQRIRNDISTTLGKNP